jgi:hypothetical protein
MVWDPEPWGSDDEITINSTPSSYKYIDREKEKAELIKLCLNVKSFINGDNSYKNSILDFCEKYIKDNSDKKYFFDKNEVVEFFKEDKWVLTASNYNHLAKVKLIGEIMVLIDIGVSGYYYENDDDLHVSVTIFKYSDLFIKDNEIRYISHEYDESLKLGYMWFDGDYEYKEKQQNADTYEERLFLCIQEYVGQYNMTYKEEFIEIISKLKNNEKFEYERIGIEQYYPEEND